jgi:hypothetical protein
VNDLPDFIRWCIRWSPLPHKDSVFDVEALSDFGYLFGWKCPLSKLYDIRVLILFRKQLLSTEGVLIVV